MGPLITVIAVGGFGWYLWHSYQKAAARIEAEEREAKSPAEKSFELEQDPKSGVYRPKD